MQMSVAIEQQKQRTATASEREKSFAEFFAGIGLVREALRTSGWKCVYANDIDFKKREIYRANFYDLDDFDERDIWDTEGVLERLPTSPFLVTSSFPCTDLSLAGNYLGFDGEHSSTFFGFTEVIRSLDPKPELMLLENVLGFLTARDGDDFKRAVLEVAGLGYRIDAFTLNADSFVPQSRPRVFIVGVHERFETSLIIKRPSRPQFGDPWYREMDRFPQLRPPTLRNLIEKTDLPTDWIATPMRLPSKTKPDLRSVIDLDSNQNWWDESQLRKHLEMMNATHREMINRFLQRGIEFVGTAYRRKRQGKMSMEVRFDGIAGCLRTPRGGSARQIVIVVERTGVKMRWMSATEYARLQGAGNFKRVENERQMLFGFGDAVCVPVIRWIDHCVLTPLFESQNYSPSL
jgi:DNA (cytosine-5)-methyltransferase 1